MTLSAHDLAATVDCDWPGCPLEAEPGETRCRDHAGRAVTATPRRLALAAEARRLREEEGLLQRQVAERLGVSVSYAGALLTDPDRSKEAARRDSYREPCPGCGKPMDGSNGRGPDAPRLCADCMAAAQHDERYWTRERIVAAFQEFARRTGRGPATTDSTLTSPSVSRKLTDERLEDGAAARWLVPHPAMVAREFGSWAAALEAAGLPPNPTGGAARRTRRNRPKGETRIMDARPGPRTTGTFTSQLRDMVKMARRLDTAAEKLSQLAAPDGLKAAFDSALERAGSAASEESLEDLLEKTKAMRRGAKRRDAAQREYDEARHELRAAVVALAREVGR